MSSSNRGSRSADLFPASELGGEISRPIYGQVTRASGRVYVIWDLERGAGFSIYLNRSLAVGELVLLQTLEGKEKDRATGLQISDLPQGVHPLIAVPMKPTPPQPPKGGRETNAYANAAKKAASGRR